MVASRMTATAVPSPSSWMNEMPDVANVADRDAEQERRGGDEPARALEPVGDRGAVLEPAVASPP